MGNAPIMYAEDVVAAEYARLSWVRRRVLRWVSPSMADAAKHLSRNPRGYVNVPVYPVKPKPGLVTKGADRWFQGSGL